MLVRVTRAVALVGRLTAVLTGTLACSMLTPAALAQNTIPKTTSTATPRYQLVVRVVRPSWRTLPTAGEANTLEYQQVHGFEVKMSHPDSEQEFLTRLRAANPKFRFDSVIRQAIVLLNADTEWQQPADFSMQTIRIAIVDQNTELLAPHKGITPAAKNFSISSTSAISQSAVQAKPVDYRTKFTPVIRERFKQQGEALLRHQYEQFCLKNDRRVPAGGADGVWMVPDGETICMNHNLSVSETPLLPKEAVLRQPVFTLNPTDLVFFTITRLK